MSDTEKSELQVKKDAFFVPREVLVRPCRLQQQKLDRDIEKSQNSQGSGSQFHPIILKKIRDPNSNVTSRPISPKKKETEKKNVKSKIDFNAYLKSRKSWEKSCKLIYYENFISDPSHNLLSDSIEEFLVVGVIGKQGLGKSTLCNILAQSYLTNEKIERIVNNQKVVKPLLKNNYRFDDGPEIVFEQATIKHAKLYNYCTKGIDMYLAKNNMILLDCQPIFSIAYVEESYYHPLNQSYDIYNRDPYNIKPEARHEVTDIQHVSFLLSVCHVIIVLQDSFCDSEIVRLILTADMLKQPILIGRHDGEVFDNTPQLIFVQMNSKIGDFSYEALKFTNQYYQDAFQCTNLEVNSGLNIYNTNMLPEIDLGIELPTNIYLLPKIKQPYSNMCTYMNFKESVKQLKWLMLNASHHSLYPMTYTQKHWFHYAGKVWDCIQRSSSFSMLSELLP